MITSRLIYVPLLLQLVKYINVSELNVSERSCYYELEEAMCRENEQSRNFKRQLDCLSVTGICV